MSSIDTTSLDNLQKSFGHRLNIARGASGEVIITAQPQDQYRLTQVMLKGGQTIFSEQIIYG